jgi:hypothetical protein
LTKTPHKTPDKNAFIAKQPSIRRGLPVEKKTLLTAAFISVFLLSAVAGTLFVRVGKANPYLRLSVQEGEVPPPDGTIPPTVSIFSPKNDTVYASSNFSLVFNVTIAKSYLVSPDISKIYYRPSWQPSNTQVNPKTANNYSINITGVPEGTHSLTVYAVQNGRVYTREVVDQNSFTKYHYYSSFEITGSSRIKFTIDITPPKVSILSIQNKTYNTPDFPLDIAVNDSVSKLTYVLDGQDNVTIPGNTTLNGLSAGEHNVTVYATDSTGLFGVSEIICFSVEIPFPTSLVVGASAALMFVIGVGFTVYFVKFKKKSG